MLGKRIILPALLALLSSCTAPVVMLVNPRTGDTRRCSVAEVGSGADAFTTDTRVKGCVHQWESLGYIQTENLTPEQGRTR